MERANCTSIRGTPLALGCFIMTNPYNNISDQRPNHENGSLLDEERVASMADEGGVSGALMELDDPNERRHLLRRQRARKLAPWQTAVAAIALVAIAGAFIGWWKRAA
jgi:hypothetical protein